MKMQKFCIFICTNEINVLSLHRHLRMTAGFDSVKKRGHIDYFAFAIYWNPWNVRSFKDSPIISRQASIVYMGVIYR